MEVHLYDSYEDLLNLFTIVCMKRDFVKPSWNPVVFLFTGRRLSEQVYFTGHRLPEQVYFYQLPNVKLGDKAFKPIKSWYDVYSLDDVWQADKPPFSTISSGKKRRLFYRFFSHPSY